MGCSAAAAALLSALNLSGCAEAPPAADPGAFYRSLAAPGLSVDAEQARAAFSAYRLNKGLKPLALDPDLQRVAREEAAAMAAADRPARAESVTRRLREAGVADPAANLSAGYHTLPEAFSGWRESPQHDKVLLKPTAARMGIATAYAPGSKYKVYWALVVGR
ncbi:MAG TPA: CAP domain-containing protein [Beijerinckiaceae bacterium]